MLIIIIIIIINDASIQELHAMISLLSMKAVK